MVPVRAALVVVALVEPVTHKETGEEPFTRIFYINLKLT